MSASAKPNRLKLRQSSNATSAVRVPHCAAEQAQQLPAVSKCCYARTHMDARLERFLDHFNELNKDSLNRVGLMYTEDVSFQDPLHEIQGLPHLKKYFGHLYRHTQSCRFEWESRLMLGNEAMVAWRMTLTHRFLNSGKPFTVPGATMLRFKSQADLVIYQRDYFDVGALLYERLPVLGHLLRAVKAQA